MRPSPKSILGAIVGSCLGFYAVSASAEAPPVPAPGRLPVVIVVPRCAKAPVADLQRIVSAELGIDVSAELVDDSEASGLAANEPHPPATEDPNVTRVTIACTRHWLRLEVLDPVSGKTLVRHIDLSANDAKARTRLLGLSAAELVAASWIELAQRPSAQPHIVEAKASPAVRDTAASAAQKALAPPAFYRLEVMAAGQRAGSGDLLTLGGGVGASWVHNGWRVVGADLLLETGSADVPLGTIQTFLASGSVSFRIRQRLGWAAVEGGLGVRGGLAHMEGVAAAITPRPEATTATLPWWGPMIMLRVEVLLAERVAFVMGLEAGRVIYAAEGRAGGQPASAIENQWVGVTFGPVLSLGGRP